MATITGRTVLANYTIGEYYGITDHFHIEDRLNQRKYEWTEIETRKLIKDIMGRWDDLKDMGNHDVSAFYNLGTTKLYNKDSRIKCIDDGQQRTITLAILMSQICIKLRNFYNISKSDVKKSKALNLLTSITQYLYVTDDVTNSYGNKIYTDSPEYKKLLDKLISMDKIEINKNDYDKSYHDLINVYNYIDSKILNKKWLVIDDSNIDDFIKFGQIFWSKTILDVITYSNLTNLQRMDAFEQDNDRSKPIQPAVKLRNNLTRLLLEKECDKKSISDEYALIIAEVNSNDEIRLDKMLFWSALIQTNETFKQYMIHDEIPNYLEKNSTTKDEQQNSVLNFLDTMLTHTKIINKVYKYDIDGLIIATRTEKDNIKNIVKCILLNDQIYSNHFLIKIFSKYNNNIDLTIKLLKSFFNKIIRYTKYGNGQSIQTKVNEALRKVYKKMDEDSTFNINDFESIINNHLSNYNSIPTVVTNLVNITLLRDTSSKDKNTVRSLLFRMEMEKNYMPFMSNYEDNKSAEIEHINSIFGNHELVGDLGNLTLFDYLNNVEAGKLDFNDKKPYYENSNFKGTRELVSLNNFLSTDVNKRKADMCLQLANILSSNEMEKNQFITEFNRHLTSKIKVKKVKELV